MQSQETNNSESSTSSASTTNNIKPLLVHNHGHDHLHQNFHASISLSPILPASSIPERSAITEGHPNALKNINPSALNSLRNFTLLQASITDIINHRHGINTAPSSAQFRRSFSTLDFRNLDPDRLSSLFSSQKD